MRKKGLQLAIVFALTAAGASLAGENYGGTSNGCDLLIICPDIFTNAARILAEWKCKRGIITEVVTTNETGSTTNSIRDYIKNGYNNWDPAPSYVLIIGDADQVPVWYVNNHPAGGSQGHVGTDFYYADMSDPFDYSADLAIGRWAVETIAQAEACATRAVQYETVPPDTNTYCFFYTNSIHACLFQDGSSVDPPDHYENARFAKTSEDIRNYLLDNGYNPHRVYTTYNTYDGSEVYPSNWTVASSLIFENDTSGAPLPAELLKPTFAWDGDPSDISAAVNAGTFLLTHNSHGDRSSWCLLFYNSDVDALINSNRRPVVFSAGCMTAWFDNETDDSVCGTSNSSECISEHWLRHTNGGAIGVIGASRASHVGHNERLMWGWMDAIWPSFIEYHSGSYDGSGAPVYRMGDVLNYAREYYKTKYSDSIFRKVQIEMYHWLGDPTLEIWTGVPQELQVSHAPATFVGKATFSVSVTQEEAQVCCVYNGRIIGKVAVSNGMAERALCPKPESAGNMWVTITKHNYIPYQGTTDVVVADSAFIQYEFHTAEDVGDSDGYIERGETALLRVCVKNFGNETATNVSATLTNVSSYLTVTDATRSYGNIAPSEEWTNTTPYSVTVAGSCPKGNHTLRITIQSDSGAWTNSFDLCVVAAAMCISPTNIVLTAPHGQSSAVSMIISNKGSAELSFEITDSLPPEGEWLGYVPSSGMLQPFDVTSISFTGDATALTTGVYTATATIFHNDPDIGDVSVPVTFIVIPTIIPEGSEFQVNTYTYTNQWYPYAAMDADGDFVVAWISDGQDGSGDGIYAQRYNAAGLAQGSEFRVNTYTNGNQWYASVAIDAEGDFVIAWESLGQDGSSDGVYAQRYNAVGVPQGSEFQVNTYTNDSQCSPSIAMDADGDFVVAWTSYGQDGSRYGVYAQRYDAAGVPQGSEFRVNSYTNYDQLCPHVAMDADGDFVVAWTSEGQDSGADYGVYAQRYNAAGLAQGSEFRVNSYTNDGQWCDSVAMDADGNFLVVWDSDGQDGSEYGVYAQRYNAEGVPQGSEFQVNTYTNNNQWYSFAAMDADGDFVVAWISDGQDGSEYGVYAQRYHAAGVPLGSEFQVNTYTNNNQWYSFTAMDADGDFVVTWQSRFQDGSGYGVYGRRYSKDSDTDGLPDWWETQYFGGTTNAVAGVDNDNDSHSNLKEYLAGTDPTNQNSVFAITEISRAFDSDFLIKWNSVTNRFYTLQKCSNLVTGSWDVVTNNIPATEPVNTVTVKVSGADALFYRVEVEQ